MWDPSRWPSFGLDLALDFGFVLNFVASRPETRLAICCVSLTDLRLKVRSGGFHRLILVFTYFRGLILGLNGLDLGPKTQFVIWCSHLLTGNLLFTDSGLKVESVDIHFTALCWGLLVLIRDFLLYNSLRIYFHSIPCTELTSSFNLWLFFALSPKHMCFLKRVQKCEKTALKRLYSLPVLTDSILIGLKLLPLSESFPLFSDTEVTISHLQTRNTLTFFWLEPVRSQHLV